MTFNTIPRYSAILLMKEKGLNLSPCDPSSLTLAKKSVKRWSGLKGAETENRGSINILEACAACQASDRTRRHR